MSASFVPGMRLGAYVVEHELGSGGMGVVLAVRHAETGAAFAMKVMHARLARDGQCRERFLREGDAARALRSHHVVRVHDVGLVPSGAPYIVMERLVGSDLERLLARRRTLPVAFVIDVALQACAALAEAHALGIVHRDLKPANLFFERGADGAKRIKIVDFGVSRAIWHDPGLTMTRTALGSPPYMAPEQIYSSKGVDARADIWSLGVTLYELLTGRLPFTGRSIPELVAAIVTGAPPALDELRPDVPPALAAIIARCLAKDRDDRYQDVEELARALRGCQRALQADVEEPTRVRPSPLPPAAARCPERLFWVAAVTMLMAVASIVLLAFEAGWLRLEG